jgi:type 1 fimbriae regulatory protein FimE
MFDRSRYGHRDATMILVLELEKPQSSHSNTSSHASAFNGLQARQRWARYASLQHYMGHKNIMHTVRYTEMAPDRFKNFWKD